MNTLRKWAAALSAAVCMAGVGPAAAEDKPGDAAKAPADRLVGTYQIVSGKHGKDPIPADRVKDALVTVTRDKIVGVAKDKSQIFVANYTVRTDGAGAAADKNQLTLTMKGEKPGEGDATGLVKFDGDTVSLIYNLPGGTPPNDLDPDENQHLFVLKRLKPDTNRTKPSDK